MVLQLKKLPLINSGVKITQKCKIPCKLFLTELEYGAAAIIKTDTNLQYIVRIFPLEACTRSICNFDSTVVLVNELFNPYSSIEFNTKNAHLIDINVIEYGDNETEFISVILIINKNIFEFNRAEVVLKDLVKNLLESYSFTTKSCIQIDSERKSFGINKIFVNSSSSQFLIKLGRNTNIFIDDVFLERSQSIKFSELKCLEDNENELDDLIDNWKIFNNNLIWSARPSLNMLIAGPAGCGKSSLCHNFIIKHCCNSFIINSTKLIKQYPGETEELLEKIFQQALKFSDRFNKKYPTVILIEDIDLICPSKPISSDGGYFHRIYGHFCFLLDKIYNENAKIIMLGTTSNIELVNTAVQRSGRFEKEICLPVLNQTQRNKIFNSVLKKLPWDLNESFCNRLSQSLAIHTPGFVVADIFLLVHFVLKRHFMKMKQNDNSDKFFITLLSKFLSTLKIMRSTSLKNADISVYKYHQDFEDIGGNDKLKQILATSVLIGVENPEVFQRFQLNIPKGILLYGPPGCSKTTFVKCLAYEAGMTLIYTSGAEVYSPYVGNAEKFISRVFDTARRNTPCIIFLDEIDTLVGNRTDSSKSDVQTRVLSILLTEIDGIGKKIHSGVKSNSNAGVLVIAATNRPDMVDKALMRPGRFDKIIHVPPPDRSSRVSIFQVLQRKIPFHTDVNIDYLVEKTEGYSGADVCNLCYEAAILALTEDLNTSTIAQKYFEVVLQNFKMSLNKNQIDSYYEFEKNVF